VTLLDWVYLDWIFWGLSKLHLFKILEYGYWWGRVLSLAVFVWDVLKTRKWG
jgi:hypothetical protein